ncbi:MAG: RICIN domain-containing protein, partial [bacterium]
MKTIIVHLSLVCAAVLLCGSVACAGILTLSGMPTIDPSRMINCNGTYYIYSTGQLAQSSVDRIHWTNGASPFDNWPNPGGTPPSVYSFLGADNTGNWAPDVIFLNNKYYLYYSVANLNTRVDVTALLTSPTLDPNAPDYGWTDEGVVVHHHNLVDLRSAIDPCPFLDTSNNLWLCYGSGYGAGVTSGTDSIFMRRLDNTTGLASSTDTTEYPVVKGRVEGPYVHYRAGYYYLFWNVDGNDTRYNIRVARSANVTGPYVNKAGSQNASESFLAATIYKNSINGNERGPGHAGILSEGGIDRLTYNFVNTSGSKVLGEQTLLWGPDGWPVAGADLAPGTYKISSLNSGLAVGVYQAGTTNGTPLDQETYTGSTFQQWTVSYTTNGSAADGYYRLTSPGSGSVAELFQANIDNGTLIDQGVWSNGNHQRWFIEQTSEGYYRMVSPVSQKVIEVPGFSTAAGTSLAQMDWNNSVNQQWIIGTTGGTPPATPAGLAATSGNGQVALTWTTVAGATAYNVKRGTLQGGPATTSVGSPTAASFTDRSVTNDIIYYYTIAAVNASGVSAQSSSLAAAKPQVPPAVMETDVSFTGGSFTPLAANDLILGNAGASALFVTTSPDGTGAASTLTDGNLKAPTSSGPLGIESGAITYNLGFGANGIGYTITGLRSLTAWGDSGRINPKYTVSYSLDGVNFTAFATVNFTATAGANGTDVALGVTGLSNVQSLRFSFPNTQQNIWVSYTELAVFGKSSGVMPTQTALDTSATYSTFGASVTFTATLQTNGVTAGSATGTIVFRVDGADVATNALAGGSASYATSGLAIGTHTVTAFYSGDADYAASTNSLVQTVEAIIDPGTYNRVPYREGFETNALGSTLSGVKGWYGAAGAAVVETNRFAPAVTGGYPLAGPHTQSLSFSGSVS